MAADGWKHPQCKKTSVNTEIIDRRLGQGQRVCQRVIVWLPALLRFKNLRRLFLSHHPIADAMVRMPSVKSASTFPIKAFHSAPKR